jgi:hypothetical protein
MITQPEGSATMEPTIREEIEKAHSSILTIGQARWKG